MGFRQAFGQAVFGRKDGRAQAGPSPLDAALAAELQRLDLYRPGLGAQAIRYVATGEGPAVLDTIAACFSATSRYTAPYHHQYAAKASAENAVALALVTGRIPPGPEVMRMLAVRQAVGSANRFRMGGVTPADDRPVLLLFPIVNAGVEASKVGYSIPWDTLISLGGLLELVKSCGGTMADLFSYILYRDEAQFLSEGSWPVSDECRDLIARYPAAFTAALSMLEARYYPRWIKLAETHGCQAMPEIAAALIAMLSKPFGKNDRELAVSALARLESSALLGLVEQTLGGADADTRFGLVDAAGRNGSPELIAVLRERAKVEKTARVSAAIQAVLEADAPALEQTSGPAGAQPGYAAIDGTFVTIPPTVEIPDETAPAPTDEQCVAFMACVDVIQAERAKELAKRLSAKDDQSRYYQPLTRDEIEATFSLMTQGVSLPKGTNYTLQFAIRRLQSGRMWYESVLERLPPTIALRSLVGSAGSEIGKLMSTHNYVDPANRLALDKLREWLEVGNFGLRELVAAEHRVKQTEPSSGAEAWPTDPVGHFRAELTSTGYRYDARPYESPLKQLPSEAVWPWLAENLQIFDEALGLQPAAKPILLDRALANLEVLPKVPQRYLAKLLEIAVTEKRPLRRRAMALLREAKDLDKRIEALLDDARQQVRVNAATWLADIRATGSEPALRKRLKKEKSDPVRAALIEALQRLGADLSDVIGPAVLIAEAEKAAQKGKPELPAWLTASGLPTVHFRDGATVPEAVLRHWLALAIRLKDPSASGQFGIYLDQLAPADARALSGWVLESWIAYDTHVSSLDEANAYAVANYPNDWRWQFKPQTAELREQIIAEIVRHKQGEMLNSGSETKGALALACRAEPIWAANRVRWFLKKHGRRSHQAMALLDVLAGIGAPAALQVVIAASARLKQKSTQARAAEIAERYAEDRGWSFDELADRTVPAAGFDDDGVLELPCGEDAKLYVARLDAALGIHLFNPEGKPVKVLPAGEDDATKESRKALSAAKKELKQVVELQGERLFEAMCVERDWPVADWRTAFHEHPVMRRLIERLVWQGLDEEGLPLGLFRPTQEGDFADAAEGAVAIDEFARVRLAHGALVDPETCRAWIAHLSDYEVKPFLAQFDTLRAPLSDEQAETEAITDRLGWTADSLTFRGVAEKRGYERVMRDGGGCNEYTKSFASHGITATIFHTGSYAIDENNRVALKELRFSREGNRGPYRLREVPPVMLAECWADYQAVAAKGAFEPEWEKVAPW